MPVCLSDLLDNAQLPQRSVPICLRGDLVAELEEVERSRNPDSELMNRLRAEMVDATVDVRLSAVERWKWIEVIGQHPPREDNRTDLACGFNTLTFYPAIIEVSWVAPESTPAQIQRTLGVISAGQFDELADAAWTVNSRQVSIPKEWISSGATLT